MKSDYSSFKNIRNNKCNSKELRNFITKLSDQNETPRELDSIPSFIELLQDNINQEPPTIEEIKKVLKSMKNGKASTDAPFESFKYATNSLELSNGVHHLLNGFGQSQTIPNS